MPHGKKKHKAQIPAQHQQAPAAPQPAPPPAPASTITSQTKEQEKISALQKSAKDGGILAQAALGIFKQCGITDQDGKLNPPPNSDSPEAQEAQEACETSAIAAAQGLLAFLQKPGTNLFSEQALNAQARRMRKQGLLPDNSPVKFDHHTDDHAGRGKKP